MTVKELLLEETNETSHGESIMKIKRILTQYGLTPNQSKIYFHLTKSSEKTASELSKLLNIPRKIVSL